MRYSADERPHRSRDGVLGPIAFAEAPLSVGVHRLGPFELTVSADLRGSDASLEVALRSLTNEPLYVESLVVGARWRPHGAERELRFLRNGWQSWSRCGGELLDDAKGRFETARAELALSQAEQDALERRVRLMRPDSVVAQRNVRRTHASKAGDFQADDVHSGSTWIRWYYLLPF